ncbi:MAG: hypothetical protein ABFE01_15005 [Phycisphaerales bacterium]
MKRVAFSLCVLFASLAAADNLGDNFKIDGYVAIPAATHRFSTGAAYQPTTLTYSIYEDGSTTGIAEDVDMTPASPFDGITGAYYTRVQLTAAAGYEVGKNYLVIVKATVDSVSAIAMHTFGIQSTAADVVTALGTGETLTALATASALATAQADLDNPSQYKATGFSTHSAADVVTALMAEEVDGETLESAFECLLSFMCGRVTVSPGAGSYTITYYLRDGTTPKMVVVSTTYGARPDTGEID